MELVLEWYRRCLVKRTVLPSFGWVIILFLVFPTLVAAQEDDAGWSPPELVAQTDGALAVSPMALVADRAGGLHLFFPHKLDEASPTSIDYVSWNGVEWSQPVDVLVMEQSGGADLTLAAIDSQQVIHVLWFDQGGTLMYSSAEAAQAWSPLAWSTPRKVANRKLSADIAVGPDDTLYVVYGDSPLPDTANVVTSTDGGERWSEPMRLASSGSGEVAIGEISVAIDEEGRLHAVWAEYKLPDGWPPVGVFYARSTLETGESPLLKQVAGEGYGDPGIAAVGADEVHLVWSSTVGGDGAYHAWSSGGGESWNAPDIYAGGSGLSGLPSYATDSDGGLHYVLGDARSASWRDGFLSPYVYVAGEGLEAASNQGEGWSPPERAEMAITTGNRLHVVFETGFQKLWHTSKLLDAPALPTSELPGSAMTSTVQPVTPEPEATLPELTAVPSPTAPVMAAPPEGPTASVGGPLAGVIAGVVAAGVVVSAAVVWKLWPGRAY